MGRSTDVLAHRGVDVPSAIARGKWLLVRRGRLRAALEALGQVAPDEALRQLAHDGATDDEQAAVLSAAAAVMAAPTLPGAERCIALLETLKRPAGPETLAGVSSVLQSVLRLDAGLRADLVRYVAYLTGRLLRVAGPLGWGHYNLAVDALLRGEFLAAGDYLTYGVVAPPGGWPVPLIGGACAALRGDPSGLSRWLASSVVDSYFSDDFRFLFAIGYTFDGLLRDDASAATMAGRLLDGQPGSLTRAVPQLAAVRALLLDMAGGGPTGVRMAELAGCGWGRWVCARLGRAGIPRTVVPGISGDASEQLLSWELVGSQQDFVALLSNETAHDIQQHLTTLAAISADSPLWIRLIGLRWSLVDEHPAARTAAVLAPDPAAYPWQMDDQVLRALASRDGETERSYLEGRHALRCAWHTTAMNHFGEARARISGPGPAARLAAFRFHPLLNYWEGVTLAHMGLAREASELLWRCAGGAKAHEAQAQLAMLAAATGDYAGTARLLDEIPEPVPASADYLRALLTERGGDATGAMHLLERLPPRDAAAGVYVAARYRLRGRLHEARGELAEASRWYRQSLAHVPQDVVAAARLARVWVRQRYDGSCPEPLDERVWSTLASTGGGLPLLLARDCLDGPTAAKAEELLGRVPADPALRLLVLRTAVACGAEASAAMAARTWAEEDGVDPRIVLAGAAARASQLLRDYCLAAGAGSARTGLAELEQDLGGGDAREPVTEFWAAVTRLMLNPVDVAAEPVLPAVDDKERSASVRLFAGVLSLFSADSEQRRKAARSCLAVLDADPPPDEAAGAMVRCLAADALEKDKDFLVAYGEIEGRESVLPCGLVAGYLAATEARLRLDDLDVVIKGFIPGPLADLSHPEVRRVMGLTHARRAARTAGQDVDAAIQDVNRARELLREPS